MYTSTFDELQIHFNVFSRFLIQLEVTLINCKVFSLYLKFTTRGTLP